VSKLEEFKKVEVEGDFHLDGYLILSLSPIQNYSTVVEWFWMEPTLKPSSHV